MQNKKMIFAHRGLADDKFPENSKVAFTNTINYNIGAELDVRLSKDGVPVVFHDETLKRMCGDSRKISDVSFVELNSMRLNGTDNTIPSLEEVLELINGKIPLLIELKLPNHNFRFKRLERKTIRLLKNYGGEYMIQSFNRPAMKFIKRKFPQIKCGILLRRMVRNTSDFDFVNYRIINLNKQKTNKLRTQYPIILGWISSGITSDKVLEIMNELDLDGAVI